MTSKFKILERVECDVCGARFITTADRLITCPSCGQEGYCEGETND